MKIFGGVEGDRTPDLMTASHALSQLSYDPIKSGFEISNPAKIEFSENNRQRQVFTVLFAGKDRFALFQKCRHAFAFVFGRKANRKQINFAAQAFVQIRARGELDGFL